MRTNAWPPDGLTQLRLTSWPTLMGPSSAGKSALMTDRRSPSCPEEGSVVKSWDSLRQQAMPGDVALHARFSLREERACLPGGAEGSRGACPAPEVTSGTRESVPRPLFG